MNNDASLIEKLNKSLSRLWTPIWMFSSSQSVKNSLTKEMTQTKLKVIQAKWQSTPQRTTRTWRRTTFRWRESWNKSTKINNSSSKSWLKFKSVSNLMLINLDKSLNKVMTTRMVILIKKRLRSFWRMSTQTKTMDRSNNWLIIWWNSVMKTTTTKSDLKSSVLHFPSLKKTGVH